MKQITLILGDGYDDAISVTAIGRCDSVINITTRSNEIHDGETLYYPEKIKPSQTERKHRID